MMNPQWRAYILPLGRLLWLAGMMGSGKSTVGRVLGTSAGVLLLRQVHPPPFFLYRSHSPLCLCPLALAATLLPLAVILALFFFFFFLLPSPSATPVVSVPWPWQR